MTDPPRYERSLCTQTLRFWVGERDPVLVLVLGVGNVAGGKRHAVAVVGRWPRGLRGLTGEWVGVDGLLPAGVGTGVRVVVAVGSWPDARRLRWFRGI